MSSRTDSNFGSLSQRLGVQTIPKVRLLEHGCHVWVSGPDGDRPGLLVAWERSEAGWVGRVVLSDAGQPVNRRVNASQLRRAD